MFLSFSTLLSMKQLFCRRLSLSQIYVYFFHSNELISPKVLDLDGVFKSGKSRAAKRGGGFKRGVFPIWTCPSFFVLFCPFWDFPDFSGIFPICPGTLRGFSRLVLFLFLGLFTAPTRNSPERVRDTIWTFPEKSGKPPGLETPRLSFSQENPTCGRALSQRALWLLLKF